MADQALTLSRVRRTIRRGSTIEDIPSEVIQEILSRLPINSMFQSRCVSKFWHNLTNGESVSTKHYARSLQNQTPTNLIIYSYHFAKSSLYYIPDIETCEKAIKLNNLPFEASFPTFEVAGSCNGFLCLVEVIFGYFCVCNPVCGNWFILPDLLGLPRREYRGILFGYGYTAKSNKYKAIRMMVKKTTRGPMTVEVYTIGSNSWRNIGTQTWTPCKRRGEKIGVFVNGCLHWMVDPLGIQAFDLETEKFASIPLPDSLQAMNDFRRLCLGTFKGCLMILDETKHPWEKVWIMKDYGVKESWVTEMKIRKYKKAIAWPFAQPLVVQSNGNIVLDYNGTTLSSYDPKNGSHELIRIPGLPHFQKAIPHVGTLPTLKVMLAKSNSSSI